MPSQSATVTDSQGRTIRLGRYRHYKNLEYQVLGVVRHSESLEDMVMYPCLYGSGECWVRPVGMFLELGYFVEGQEACPRFSFIEDMAKSEIS